MGYTVDEALQVIHYVKDTLETPENLSQEGILRVASDKSEQQQTIAQILEGRNPELKNDPILLADMIKATTSIQGNKLFEDNEPLLQPLKNLLDNADNVEPEQVMQALSDLVNGLVESGNPDNFKKAEVIHYVANLCWQTTNYQEANKMTPNNASISCLGPFLLNVVNLGGALDPLSAIAKTGQANDLGKGVLSAQDNAFSQSFDIKYAQQIYKAQAERYMQLAIRIDELEHTVGKSKFFHKSEKAELSALKKERNELRAKLENSPVKQETIKKFEEGDLANKENAKSMKKRRSEKALAHKETKKQKSHRPRKT